MEDSKVITPGRTGLVSATALLGFIAIGCAAPQNIQLASAGVDYWRADLDGDIQFTDNLVTGTKIDLVDTLGLDKRDEDFAYRGSVALGPVVLEGQYFEIERDGDQVLTETISFQGQTFVVSDRVLSHVEGVLATAYAKFGVIGVQPQDGPGFSIGGLVGIDYVKMEASIRSTTLALEESEDASVIFPVGGVTASFELPLGESLSLVASGQAAGFFGVEYADIEGSFVDARGDVGIRLAKLLTVSVGYRFFDVDFEDGDDNEANVTFSGPYVLGQISF
ncbi:MAG: hypothetical protein AB7I09_00015 [Planctomycetota bacterium]